MGSTGEGTMPCRGEEGQRWVVARNRHRRLVMVVRGSFNVSRAKVMHLLLDILIFSDEKSQIGGRRANP